MSNLARAVAAETKKKASESVLKRPAAAPKKAAVKAIGPDGEALSEHEPELQSSSAAGEGSRKKAKPTTDALCLLRRGGGCRFRMLLQAHVIFYPRLGWMGYESPREPPRTLCLQRRGYKSLPEFPRMQAAACELKNRSRKSCQGRASWISERFTNT